MYLEAVQGCTTLCILAIVKDVTLKKTRDIILKEDQPYIKKNENEPFKQNKVMLQGKEI